ncbi:hypothetical protein [Sphingomonas sp. 7/4-4]|uniref:hypothetical protein n=1 Tax=Sphingomonas sp. 7/4-4 TaxID=3018446 RepID=UPI00300E6075
MLTALIIASAVPAQAAPIVAGRQVERLDRALVAVPAGAAAITSRGGCSQPTPRVHASRCIATAR